MHPHEDWFAVGGGAEKIQGFISARAARAITAILTDQKERGVLGSLAEIGAYNGKTFIGMALAARPQESVLGLDIFPGSMVEDLTANLKALLPTENPANVRLIKTDSTKLATVDWIRLLGAPVRFAHIDGDHTRDAVLSDMSLVSSHLAEEAVVVIDDYLHDWFPDVTEGVIDGLKISKNLRPVAVIPRSGPLMKGGTKLVCATPKAWAGCRDLMIKTFPEVSRREFTLAGHPAFTLVNND